MWKKIEPFVYVMAFIGFLDMAYQASTHDDCGPIKRVLSWAFPNAPGACEPCTEPPHDQ